MVIYGNNLAEKLFGIAISRDHLRYATSYCELVDDPDFAVDIDLAVSFNSAIEGDRDAGRRAVETLILNSSMLDQSTIDFYVDKMHVHPYFQDEIRRINDIFNDPNYPNFKGNGSGGSGSGSGDDGGFLEELKDATQDCINSPCNVFRATSDSVGRLAQTASTKTSENTFDLGGLAGVTTNLINGLDQAIFNSIPSAFQQGVVEVTAAAKQSWTNAQAVFMGKGNISAATSMAINTGSMRSSTDKIFSFSPDIKSFFDFDQLEATILSEVSNSLGGCFDKFQSAYRYNPYTDNMSRPLGYGVSQVNGVSYSHDPGGTYSVVGMSRAAADDCSELFDNAGVTSIGSGGDSSSNSVQIGKGEKLVGENYYISIPVVQNTKAGSDYNSYNGWPFMVGSYIEKPYIIRAESGTGGQHADNAKVISPNINICPGIALSPPDNYWIDSAENANELDALTGKKKLKDINKIVHLISNGWKHQIDEVGMTEFQDNPIFDDGAIINPTLLRSAKILPDAIIARELPNGDIIEGIANNKVFLVIRQTGQCAKIVKVIFYSQKTTNPVFGLTPAAYKYVYGKDPRNAEQDTKGEGGKMAVKGEWEVYKAAVVHSGDTEVRVAVGDYDAIKEAVDKEIGCTDIEIAGSAVPVVMVNKGSIRNKDIHPELKRILGAAGGAAGLDKITVNSGGQDPVGTPNGRRTGSRRHDVFSGRGGTGGPAADFQIYKNGSKVNISDESIWDTFAKAFISLSRQAGFTPSGSAAPGYMGSTTAHFDIAKGFSLPSSYGSTNWSRGYGSYPKWTNKFG